MLKFEWTKEHTVALIYTCVTILLAIPLVLVILFPGILGGALGGLVDALSPVLIGFAVAYLLFPVCNFFEKKVCGFIEKKKPRPRLRRIAAVVLTLLAAIVFLVFFVWMLVPQIKASYLNLEATFDTYLEKASVYLGEVTAKYTEPGTEPVFDSAALLDTVGGWIDSLFDQVGNFMSSAVSYSSKLLNTIWRIIFSLIFMVVFLVEKDAIGARLNSIASTLLTRRGKAFCDKWVRYTDESFGGFISGKILDAVIITLINFIVFGLAGIPYYPLVSLVCGVTDVIPYFGPFIGAVPCAFIILIADPIKMIWFIVLTLVIQQCDGNIIGPKILGETLEAILSMFGDRIGRLLFKQTVEHNVMNHILACDTDIDAATYQKMRGMSYQEVVQTHGQISFPEVLRKEKAL